MTPMYKGHVTVPGIDLDPTRRVASRAQRAYLWERDKGQCQVCRATCDPDDWDADHVVPWPFGPTVVSNLRVTHGPCNLARRTAIGPTPFGYRRAVIDGRGQWVLDELVDLTPLFDAYREAGSIRATVALLNRRGIPAPKGGLWAVTPLVRILTRFAKDGLVALPERSGPKRRRYPVIGSALFAGLLRCHCGRRMTPNVTRGQYYCAGARVVADHGRMSVTEKALVAALSPLVRTDWSDVAATSALLRRVWTGVQLDTDMTPVVEWRAAA